MRLYMHLIDGRPAEFQKGMICFARTGRHARHGPVLCLDREQVKQEQAESAEYRRSRRMPLMDYDYMPVDIYVE